MNIISSGLSSWLLFLSIYFTLFGLGALFTQDFLAKLFFSTPLEPQFIRITGCMDWGLAYLAYKAYASKAIEVAKPILETFILIFLLTGLGVAYNWGAYGTFGSTAYILYIGNSAIFFIVSLLLYPRKD